MEILRIIILLKNYLYTKIWGYNARIIRLPFFIRGKKFIRWEKGFTTGVGCRLEAFSSNKVMVMKFGNNVQLNDYVHITAMKCVSVGNNVLMASKIYISDCVHGFYNGNKYDSSPLTFPIERKYQIKAVIIEDNVWLGESVCVLPGVTIGKGSIIGALSVVTKSIPPYSIAVGNPARVIKKFNFDTNKWERI